MIGRAEVRAAALALFAIVAIAVAPREARAQDLSCGQGDKEVLGLDFRGNRSIRDADAANRDLHWIGSRWIHLHIDGAGAACR